MSSDIWWPVIAGLAVGIAFIALFMVFTIIPLHIFSIENLIPTEPRITQTEAIAISKQDITANYVKYPDFIVIVNYSHENGNARIIPIDNFTAGKGQVPLVYSHPNGTYYGIDVKTHSIKRCGVSQASRTIICIQPTNEIVIAAMRGKLAWILDMAAGCEEPKRIEGPIFFVIDANNGQILWSGGSPASDFQGCNLAPKYE